MYKYIVFDFDGTLVDSRGIFLMLYNELATKHGYTQMTSENLEQLRGLSISERCKILKVPLYKLPFLAAEIIKKYKASIPALQFNVGIKEMLESMAAGGMPYAVLSSNSKSNIQEFFALQGIAVTDIYTSGKIFGKDTMLKKFLKDKSLTASEILYLGDEARDIIACKKAGVKIAWVIWGYDSYAAIQSHSPDYIINHPSELLNLILRQE
ncbi:HAD-IA family hydrolase [Flavobacterium sp. DGU11]|uniref:HAD-IA family hydrolase n=1 Tax=Flavobacterium arundinis TaxID=3139143 RepID=A0ABU9HTY9_9FLAO